MVSFENFVKSMPPSLSELKVTPSFCFSFKIPDDPTATNTYYVNFGTVMYMTFFHRGINRIRPDCNKTKQRTAKKGSSSLKKTFVTGDVN